MGYKDHTYVSIDTTILVDLSLFWFLIHCSMFFAFLPQISCHFNKIVLAMDVSTIKDFIFGIAFLRDETIVVKHNVNLVVSFTCPHYNLSKSKCPLLQSPSHVPIIT